MSNSTGFETVSLLIFLAFMAVALAIIAKKSIAIAKEGERLVVFRLGELFAIYPPGMTFLIPFIDRGVKVRVDQIAGWKTMPEDELQRKLAEAVKNPA
ncbi:MAG: hypothetical protein AABM67_20465 [Acidobacteriota bacterium]